MSKECEKQRQTREKSEHEMTELEQVVQKKTNEMEALNARLVYGCIFRMKRNTTNLNKRNKFYDI